MIESDNTSKEAANLTKLILGSAELDEPPTLAKENLLRSFGLAAGLSASDPPQHVSAGNSATELSQAVSTGSTGTGLVAGAVKIFVLAVVGAGAAVLAVNLGRSGSVGNGRPVESDAPVTAIGNPVLESDNAEPRLAPSPSPAATAVETALRPLPVPRLSPRASEANLALEVRLLDRARAELGRGAHRQASARLDEYERRFRNSGTLQPEAAALRLEVQKAALHSSEEK